MNIRENIPISDLTTMRIGGPARYVIDVNTADDIIEAYNFAKQHNLPVWVMGGGANTLGRDEGFDGVIILNELKGIFVHKDDGLIDLRKFKNKKLASSNNQETTQRVKEEKKENKTPISSTCEDCLDDKLEITAMAGEVWDEMVEIACSLGYSGIEALSMIPGTVGAAPVQNIGAYGQDIAQVIKSVEVFDIHRQKITTLDKEEMQMGYRHTRFNYGEDAGRFIILSMTMTLNKERLQPPFYNSLQRYVDTYHETDFSPANIRRMICEIRSEKLPDPKIVASAGSFFKNVYLDQSTAEAAEAQGIPVWRNQDGSGKINSGWLIEQCGFKGKNLYGFKVSDKAALVLINESAKSFADLEKARSEIIDAVKSKFGFTIEQEPVEIHR